MLFYFCLNSNVKVKYDKTNVVPSKNNRSIAPPPQTRYRVVRSETEGEFFRPPVPIGTGRARARSGPFSALPTSRGPKSQFPRVRTYVFERGDPPVFGRGRDRDPRILDHERRYLITVAAVKLHRERDLVDQHGAHLVGLFLEM